MAASSERIVVVGASLSGLQAAQTFRRSGFEGSITIVGDEPHFPYDRPPLSKQFLCGEWDEEKLVLRGARDPEEFGFTWRVGVRAVGLDLDQRQVLVENVGISASEAMSEPEALPYDGLVIATGARARQLPGNELAGVHVVRGLDDARSLKAELASPGKTVLVIGAGFIGAEVAATARELGHNVVLVEAAETPLARVLDPAAGSAIADLHRSHGVDVRLGMGVERLTSTLDAEGIDRVSAAVLGDGTTIDVDIVVVGIGVVPNTDWLEKSGLDLGDGVVVDQFCVAAPGVVAAGDVARFPNARFGGKSMRVEQWDNAVEQGSYAAKSLLGYLNQDPTLAAEEEPAQPYAPIPWFWSDQYDRKIQLAGVPSATAEVVHGSIAEHCFVQIYADDQGAFVGALAWSRPRHAIKAKQLLAKGATMGQARELLK